MDVDAGFTWESLIPLSLGVAALAAFLFALASFLQAWSLSIGHPAFDALGVRKWVMGIRVIGTMPPAATPYVKRYYAGFVAFILAIVCLVAYSIVKSAPAP